MKRWNWLCIMLLIVFILGGCWDRKEINEVSIVSGLTLEKGPADDIMLSVEIINAPELSEQAEGFTPVVVHRETGKTLSELLNKMNSALARDLIFSHVQTVIIDENLAREGIGPYLQYLEKDARFRSDFLLLVAKDTRASEIAKTTFPIHKVPSIKLFLQFETLQEKWGGFPDSTLTDWVNSLTTDGIEPIAGVVTIKGDGEKMNTVEGNYSLDLPAIIEMGGVGVFDEERLVDFLSLEQTRHLLWLKNQIKETVYSTRCGEGDLYISSHIFHSNTSIDSFYRDGVPHFNVRVVLEGEISDNQCGQPLDEVDTYEHFEKLISEQLTTELQTFIEDLKTQFKVDIVGFGEVFQRQQYPIFKTMKDHWNEEFTKSTVEVEVKTYIRRNGIRTRGFLDQINN